MPNTPWNHATHTYLIYLVVAIKFTVGVQTKLEIVHERFTFFNDKIFGGCERTLARTTAYYRREDLLIYAMEVGSNTTLHTKARQPLYVRKNSRPCKHDNFKEVTYYLINLFLRDLFRQTTLWKYGSNNQTAQLGQIRLACNSKEATVILWRSFRSTPQLGHTSRENKDGHFRFKMLSPNSGRAQGSTHLC